MFLGRGDSVQECGDVSEKEGGFVAEPKEDGLVKSVEGLLAEKQALAAREKKLIEDLNTVLGKMGYRVVAIKVGSHAAGTGRKPGRPPGSGKGQAPKVAATP